MKAAQDARAGSETGLDQFSDLAETAPQPADSQLDGKQSGLIDGTPCHSVITMSRFHQNLQRHEALLELWHAGNAASGAPSEGFGANSILDTLSHADGSQKPSTLSTNSDGQMVANASGSTAEDEAADQNDTAAGEIGSKVIGSVFYSNVLL